MNSFKTIGRTWTAALLLSTSLIAVPTITAQAAHQQLAALSDQYDFTIEQQPLTAALRAFSRSTGAEVLVDSALVEGRTSAGVRGRHSGFAALKVLLGGHPIQFDEVGGRIVLKSSQAAGAPLSATAGPASASRVENEIMEPIENIVVTGSRISRNASESIAPIAITRSEDIRLTGTLNLETLLNDTPQFTAASTGRTRLGSGAATLDLRGIGPSRTLVLVNGRRFIPYDQDFLTDINTIPSALIERTEVVTGRSSAVYGSDAIAGVVNFILRKDIEGIETSAQYKAFKSGDGETFDLNIMGGGAFAGGRGSALLSVNYLTREEVSQAQRANLNVYVIEGLDASGRPALVPSGSSNIPNGRLSGFPTGAALNTPTNAGLRTALQNANLGNVGSLGFTFDDAGTVARVYNANTDYLNTAPNSLVQKPQDRWAINSFLDYEINDRISAYGEASFSQNKTLSTLDSTGLTGQFQFNTDNPYLSPAVREVLRQLDMVDGTPNGLVTLSVARRLVEVGQRTNEFTRNAWRIVGGSRIDIGDITDTFLTDIDLDLYYSRAESSTQNRNAGGISISAFQRGLLRGPNGEQPLLNIFGQNISRDGAASIGLAPTNSSTVKFQVVSAAFAGTVAEVPAGEIRASAGSEWRKSGAVSRPDDSLRTGDVSGIGAVPPTDGASEVLEGFGEIRVPLLKDVPFAESLSVSGAARYSVYDVDTVGGVWTYSGGGEWQPIPDIRLRSQYQRAIRAPNVGELFGGQTTENPTAVDPCSRPAAAADPRVRDTCIATGVPAALVGNSAVQPNVRIDGVFGGNPNLRPERSNTFTAGVVFEPSFLPNATFSADYFEVKVVDAIAPLAGGTASILNLCYNVIQDPSGPVCQAINRNPVDGAIVRPFRVEALNENIGKFEVAGIDFGAQYFVDFDRLILDEPARLSFSMQGSWYDKVTTTPIQELPNQKNECVGAFGATCIEPKPTLKMTNRITYSVDRASISVRHRFINKVTIDQILLPQRQGIAGPTVADFAAGVLPAQHYFDIAFSYDVTESVMLNAGVNNVFDKNPPFTNRNVSEFNTFPSTYEPLGYNFYMGLTAKF